MLGFEPRIRRPKRRVISISPQGLLCYHISIMTLKIQSSANRILNKLHKAGFKAYLVGGCVRDLLLKKTPKDWDIATSAKPKQIQKLFPKHFYNNKFGTVTVLPSKIEVTTFRKESKYTDKRHPDVIEFTTSIRKDLERRDFTINALAYDGEELVGDASDLERKLIRAVGSPEERFREDALRLIRAVRFAVQLGFEIEQETQRAVKKNSGLLRFIAKERIKDELIKILMSEHPDKGLLMLRDLGLLRIVLPELELGVGVSQNKHHIYTVFEHSLRSLQTAAKRNYNLEVRLASLFHDIAKPEVKQGDGPDASFRNHDIVGAKWASRILRRLRFEKKIIDKVYVLVRRHMFLSDPQLVTEAAARRLIRHVDKGNIQDLINLRITDRLGSGVPKARPYRLRHFEYLLDKVSRDPINESMLKINGNDILQILQIKPGPKVGLILRALLNEVLDNPEKNKKLYLEERAKELGQLSDKELGVRGKELVDKKEEIELSEKKKFWL